MKHDRYKMKPLWVAMAASLALGGLSLHVQALEDVHYTATHVFSMDDIQGGFDGKMFGSTPGGVQDTSIICDAPGSTASCPPESDYTNVPFTETKGSLDGIEMYPIDSEFGFYVQDYVGAAQKQRDAQYKEGWAGNATLANLPPGEDSINYPLHLDGTTIGLALSNEATARYKVNSPWGRWCSGAGGASVKCETEHYVVMENIRSCYETIPYFYGDPDAADRATAQGVLYDPADYDWLNPDDPYAGDTPVGTCVLGQLDNLLYEIVDGQVDTTMPLGVDAGGFPDMPPNESSVRYDIAASTHYAITKKDDGKALYRFGNMDKRPNDIRMYARLPLPDEWKSDDAPADGFTVTKAKLIIRHLITNNPNDQVRSEDMENEGAIGRKPHYEVSGDQWWSTYACYEGDGDFIGAGTVLKNESFAYTPDALPADMRNFAGAGTIDDVNGVPYPYSTDLHGGYTAAWYTTTDREPFEWAYDTDGDGIVDISTPVEDSTKGTLLSGPRWRLRPNKFGQDLPGLEVPTMNCMPTPYTSVFVKYPVATPTVMEHDLLDFAVDSPLANSNGWIKGNGFNHTLGELGISVNGLPITEDFDLAVYVKGDRKTTAIYNATLEIDYLGDDVPPPPDPVVDGKLESLSVPATHVLEDGAGLPITVSALVTNLGTANIAGSVNFTGWYNRRAVEEITCAVAFTDLAPGASQEYQATCEVSPGVKVTLISWGAKLVVSGDEYLDNNTIYLGDNITKLLAP